MNLRQILRLTRFGVLEQKLFRNSILVVVEVRPREGRIAAVRVVVLPFILWKD
jgi:hypothetical protein